MKEIYRGRDDMGAIVVLDAGDYRYLSFADGDEQSCQLKAQPEVLQHEYTRAMCLALLMMTPKNVVVLGLGGGAWCILSTIVFRR